MVLPHISSLFLVSSTEDSFQQPELFEFDHVHANSKAGSPVAILYGALGTDCFREFHLALLEAAKEVSNLHYSIILSSFGLREGDRPICFWLLCDFVCFVF